MLCLQIDLCRTSTEFRICPCPQALNLRFNNPESGEDERLCMSYVRSQAFVTSLLVLASVAIVLINCALQGP